jgi:uracil-DNA glycosylase family protein
LIDWRKKFCDRRPGRTKHPVIVPLLDGVDADGVGAAFDDPDRGRPPVRRVEPVAIESEVSLAEWVGERCMARYPTAEGWVPESRSLRSLARAAEGCRGCDLWKDATHLVFGEGTKRAEVMLVGEQPGDREDLEGRPFVGPAGRLLDDALARAGIDRGRAYVTNAVKHFKWRPRGTRRIHDKPSWTQTLACRPWLLAELEAVEPRALVLMGATAAQALLGRVCG